MKKHEGREEKKRITMESKLKGETDTTFCQFNQELPEQVKENKLYFRRAKKIQTKSYAPLFTKAGLISNPKTNR